MTYLGAPDATTTSKGKIQLTNDLGGTGDQPTPVTKIGFSAYRSVDSASIPASTFTKVTMDSEEYDLNNDFDLTTSTFTAPVDGIYFFTSQIEVQPADKRYLLTLYRNGSEYKRGTDLDATVAQGQVVSCVTKLVATDYIELYMWHDVAGVIDGTGTGEFCSFQGHLIART